VTRPVHGPQRGPTATPRPLYLLSPRRRSTSRTIDTQSGRRPPFRTSHAAHEPPPHRPGSHHPKRARSRRQAAPCPDHDEPGPPAGASALDRAGRRPAIRIASIVINDPDDVTNDSRASSTTRLPIALRFTYGVPSRLRILRLQQSQESPAGQALPCITRRHNPQHHETSRLGGMCRRRCSAPRDEEC
jgi:hypothetical protein